jgi:hypothetical protein
VLCRLAAGATMQVVPALANQDLRCASRRRRLETRCWEFANEPEVRLAVPTKFVVFGMMQNGKYVPIGNAESLEQAKSEAADFMAAHPDKATSDFRIILTGSALAAFLDPTASQQKPN